MDKFQAMEVFVRVVDTGSFTRAAEALRLAKPAATKLVQSLEASLGVKLLNRTTRHVSLTADGAAYYERCSRILADLHETEDALANIHAAPAGRLRVEASALMARLVIIPALGEFLQRYPLIHLELGCSDRPVDLLQEGVDCAIWSGDIPDSLWVARRVGLLHVATCAAPAYLVRHGRPAHPRELDPHECIGMFDPRSSKVEEWDYSKDGERFHVKAGGRIAVNDANGYLAAAQSGLGIARLPAFVLKESMDRGLLEPVLGEWFSDPVPLQAVYPQRQHLSTRVRVFVDWIAKLFAEHDAIQLRSSLGQAAGSSPSPA